MKDAISAAAAVQRERVAAFVSELITIPSMAGEEGPVVERIRKEMIALGYDEVRVDRMGNLIGRVGDGPRLLAIDGHCDTVDVGRPELWEVDPFGGEVRSGDVFGTPKDQALR